MDQRSNANKNTTDHPTTQNHYSEKPSKGPGSFCIPRAAFNALLDAKATAYEICAYLVLATFAKIVGAL